MTAQANDTFICEHCGDEFNRHNNVGPLPKFCSPSHRQAAYLDRRLDRLIAEAVQAERQRILGLLVDDWVACEHDDPSECDPDELACIVRSRFTPWEGTP